MNITPAALKTEYLHAMKAFPELAIAERHHELPRMLLFAVGSRETNLTNEVGDGGHGHGIFSLDDRSHTIPVPFPPKHQAELAGAQLGSLYADFHTVTDKILRVQCAAAAYNCGRGQVTPQHPDRYTAGGDYGADVVARMCHLQVMFPISAA